MDFDSQVLRLATQSNEEVRQLFDQYFDELARLSIPTPKQGEDGKGTNSLFVEELNRHYYLY